MVIVSDTPSRCARAIACGQPLTGNISAIGKSDTFRFLAAAGETVSVTSRETGGFLSACWEAYDPKGMLLGGACGQGEKTLAMAGGYTIRVSDSSDLQTGSYDLNLAVTSD